MPPHPPTNLILPVERRQALQKRVASDIPRYARVTEPQQKYQCHYALAVVEHAVDEGILRPSVLKSDNEIMGVVLARSWERDAQEGRVATVPAWVKESPDVQAGIKLWVERGQHEVPQPG